jgi:3-dehydroquinate dehydratase I
LSQELKSLKDISIEHDNANTKPKKQPSTIAVVHDDDRVMDLFCTVLGQPKASAKAFTVDSVISIPRSQAEQSISTLRGQRQLIVVNTKNALEPASNSTWVSTFCDYEFVYDPSQSYRKGLAHFVRMILGQSDFHERVTAKTRTTFIALTFPNVQSALQNLDILSIGADAVELRVDLLKEPSGIDKTTNGIPFSVDYVGSQVSALRNRTELPIVFTVRSASEGGLFPTEAEAEAHELLRKAIQWGCEYLDVEARFPKSIRQDLSKRKGVSKIISSYHDLSGRMRWSSVDVTRVYHAAREYGDIVKIIGFANTLAENYELEYFRSSMTTSYGTPLLAINAGTMGQLSRVLNKFFTPTTHPLLPMAAAPGQLSAAEINGALHIVGQLPSRTYFSIGKQDASPLTGFFQKFFNELGLHHRHSTLDNIPEDTLAALARQSDFGGATVHPPIKIAQFIKSVTSSARSIGLIDTLYLRSEGSTNAIVGDNTSWRGIHATLTSDFAPLTYRNKPALVLANSPDDAASAIYALIQLECSPIYTIGFSSYYSLSQVQHLRHPTSLKTIEKNLFVVISALPAEQSHLCQPLLQMITLSQPVTSQKGRVFVDLANGPRRGDPLGAAKAMGWDGYGVSDVVAWQTKETIGDLIGENVPFDFVRTACGGGIR